MDILLCYFVDVLICCCVDVPLCDCVDIVVLLSGCFIPVLLCCGVGILFCVLCCSGNSHGRRKQDLRSGGSSRLVVRGLPAFHVRVGISGWQNLRFPWRQPRVIVVFCLTSLGQDTMQSSTLGLLPAIAHDFRYFQFLFLPSTLPTLIKPSSYYNFLSVVGTVPVSQSPFNLSKITSLPTCIGVCFVWLSLDLFHFLSLWLYVCFFMVLFCDSGRGEGGGLVIMLSIKSLSLSFYFVNVIDTVTWKFRKKPGSCFAGKASHKGMAPTSQSQFFINLTASV